MIILLLVLGGFGIYLSQNHFKPLQKTCTLEAKICPDGSSVARTGPKCEFSPCPTNPTPTPDPTADWKTYESEKLGVSFKYPEEWYLNEEVIPNSVFIAAGKIGYGGIVVAEGNDYNTEYEGTSKLEINKLNTDVGETGGYTTLRLPDIYVDKTTAAVLETKPDKIGINYPLDTIYIKKANSYYKIWVSGNTQDEYDSNKKIFDLLLSTFKFTDQDNSQIISQPYSVVSTSMTSPKSSFTVTENLQGDYNTISVKASDGRLVVDDLILKNKNK